MPRQLLISAFAALFLTSVASAQVVILKEERPASKPPAAEDDMAEHTTPQVDFTSGGIGRYQRTALEKFEHNYTLKVENADDNGHYIAEVRLKVKDEDGNLLVSTITKGPLFYADLEKGDYIVEARHGDEVQRQEVSIGFTFFSPERLVFVWKDESDDTP